MIYSVASRMQSRRRRSKKKSRALPAAATSDLVVGKATWYRAPFALALLSGLLWWASFPPLNLWPLAWLAPVGLLTLVRRKSLEGKRPYAGIWLAGFVHWLLILQFLRLPHWTGYFGWMAISFYLAFYFPLFVGLARVAVHQCRVGVIVAAPVVWVALELVRGHLFTGFSLALLGHSQVAWTWLIQISDLFGAYGVSFVVMLVAACAAQMLPCGVRRARLWPALPMLAAVLIVLGYGYWRMADPPRGGDDQRLLRVALIQGNYKTVFDSNLMSNVRRSRDSFDDYLRSSLKACGEQPDLDLVIWPESMFSKFEFFEDFPDQPIYLYDMVVEDDVVPEPGSKLKPHEYRANLHYYSFQFEDHARKISKRLNRAAESKQNRPANIAMLVGCDTMYFQSHRHDRYNSALLIDSDGSVADRYFKMHRVLFGEYVPLGNKFPWLYQFTPMSEGLAAGVEPRAFQVKGLNLAPSVCFESVVPHLIRRHVAELRRRGSPVDVLINITNDGWFHGSSALDLHLTCNVFRAVENRLPMLVAANTGLSAWIDGNGSIRQRGPRQESAYLVADVRPDGRFSLYQRLGDWPIGLCLLLTGVVALLGLVTRLRPGPARS